VVLAYLEHGGHTAMVCHDYFRPCLLPLRENAEAILLACARGGNVVSSVFEVRLVKRRQ
jgi:hypothetical protein